LIGLACAAVYLAFLAVEVMAEGDRPGSAAAWVHPLRDLAGGFIAARAAAAVAPTRKTGAAATLGAAFCLALLAAKARALGVVLGAVGATAACAASALRGAEPEKEEKPG
jgi:hypothetical protein